MLKPYKSIFFASKFIAHNRKKSINKLYSINYNLKHNGNYLKNIMDRRNHYNPKWRMMLYKCCIWLIMHKIIITNWPFEIWLYLFYYFYLSFHGISRKNKIVICLRQNISCLSFSENCALPTEKKNEWLPWPIRLHIITI